MANFDESSDVIACKTEFGRWYQTVDEIYIEISLQKPIASGKEINCIIKSNHLSLKIKNETIFDGILFGRIRADESTWTLEDKILIRILLIKAIQDAGNCWKSIFADGKFSADPLTFDRMQQKLTLQRFQLENPGMDFSGAEISGNYQGGGPKFPD